MVRANKGGVVDVGPRSAHIAGLEYSVFTAPEKIVDPKLEFFSPKPGDPADYAAITCAGGVRVTITNSCAANVLGLVKPEHFSYGSAEASRKAMKPLADYCGVTVEEIAKQIMDCACSKVKPIIFDLADKYKLEKDQISLVGVGGGAAALIVYFSEKMGLRYSIPENAEVISSIGVALAMVRDVVERIIPNPSPSDIRAIKAEAINKAIESGAAPDTVEVHIEIDPLTSKVTAIAIGSTEVKTADLLKACGENEARALAAEDMRIPYENAALAEKSKYFYIFADKQALDSGKPGLLRILDTKGFIKVQRSRAAVKRAAAANIEAVLKQLWEEMAVYKSEVIIRPDFYLCIGARVMDYTCSDFEQLKLLVGLETADLNPDDELLVAAANTRQD